MIETEKMYSTRILRHHIRCRSSKCRKVYQKQHHIRFAKAVQPRALDYIWHGRTKAAELYFHSEESSRLGRAEDMIRENSMLNDLWSGNSPIRQQASFLLGQDVELFKDKLLIKWPKMKGFRPHQDIVAYDPRHEYITARIALDNVSVHQGPIEFAKDWSQNIILPKDEQTGCIHASQLHHLQFEPQPILAGDVLFFSGYIPHQSGENNEHNAHVALYLTFSTMASGAANYYMTRSTRMKEQSRWIQEAKRLRNQQQQHNTRSSLIGHSRDHLEFRQGRRSYHTIRDIDVYVDRVYDDLSIIYRSEGHHQYDPFISHLQHAVTSAFVATQGVSFMEKDMNKSDMVVASLLHDIGHLLVREHRHQENFLQKDKRHELIGTNYLRRHGFSPAICMSIQLHVQAKRAMQTILKDKQLTDFVDAFEMFDVAESFEISETSQQSLCIQGGCMTPEELKTFFNQPFALNSLVLRGIENISKQTDVQMDNIPKWYDYEEVVKHVLRENIMNQYRFE